MDKEPPITSAALLLHRADGAALDTVFRPAADDAADPFARSREVAWTGPGCMSTGRLRLDGEIAVEAHPHTELLAVVDGTLRLQPEGEAPVVLRAGDAVVIGRGTALRLQAVPAARAVYCAAASTAAAPGLTRLHAQAAFKPSSPPAVEVLIGPAPQCRSDNVYTDASSQLRAGTWDSTPYHRIVRPHPVHEFMLLLAGAVRFAAPDGSELQASAGDAIFVPKGAPVGWQSETRVAKFYVVQDVPA